MKQHVQDFEQKFRDVTHEYYFAYQFSRPLYMATYKEYLIYDAIGMIGSVGGTLGLCIGFSFTNVASYLTNLFKKALY